MNTSRIPYTIKKYNRSSSTCIILVTTTFSLFFFSIFYTFPGTHSVYAVELFSKEEAPFGLSYDDWVSKYWNWTISLSTGEATPKQNGCLINKSESLVMLMGTTVGGSPYQVCEISSKHGIMIPLWIAWCDTGDPLSRGYSDEQLTKCARERYNLGNIRSEVKVDGLPVAKLDVRMSLISGKLDYKINSLTNVTELYTKGFDLTIPPDTQKAYQVPGTWRAGSHGWFVFLKPLPPGEHTIFYNVRVTPTGALTSPGTTTVITNVTYLLKVN
jgi:hypothetical protein